MSFDREKLREELIRDEGVKFEIYNDHLGYPTFGIGHLVTDEDEEYGKPCLLYTSPSPRDRTRSRMPSSA